MPNYAQRIEELTEVRRRANTECESQRRVIGERVVELDPENRPEGTEELIERHAALRAKVESAGSAIERMIAIDDRQAQIRERMKSLQSEREQLAKGLDAVYEQIGARAFRLFQNHPLVDSKYSTAFSGLAHYQDEVRRLDAKLDQVQAEPHGSTKSWMERVRGRGQEIILRNRKTVRENQLPKLLQDAGRKLAETDFVEQIDDDELTRVSAPVRETDARKREIDEELETLRRESGALVAEFNSLSHGEKLQRAKKLRESEIEAARTELNTVLTGLGRAAVQARSGPLTAEINSLLECEKRRDHFDELIERLQAGHRADLLEQECAEIERRQADVEGRIKKLQDELTDLADSLREKRSRQDELRRRRGDESELFDA